MRNRFFFTALFGLVISVLSLRRVILLLRD